MRRLDNLLKLRRDRGTLAAAKFAASRVARAVTSGTFAPPNTVQNNLDLWSRYDWSLNGEEWSVDKAWKASLVEQVLNPNIPEGSDVLEIGPGAGRWTEYLLKRAQNLFVVDLTPECIRLCKERFAGATNITYFVNDGRSLDCIASSSVDRIWSFDVFVHIAADDVQSYVRHFARILKPGGRGVIHHSAHGTNPVRWRSDMTTKRMASFCHDNQLRVIQQFRNWGDFAIGEDEKDIITIFEKQ